MYDLSDERYFGTYAELLHGVLCCMIYQELCEGRLKLADGSKYAPRTVTVMGVTTSEADAYEAAGIYLWKAACMIANVDENSTRFGSMPRLYDTTCSFDSGVMTRWSEHPDDEFWLRGLLHAMYSKTRLDSLNIPDSILLDKINLAISALFEASPLDGAATRQMIAKMWASSAPIPDMRKISPEKRQTGQAKASSGGCYLATAVYGSYDCPEVWTLRRFRDYRLAKTAIGRLFIRAYYAASPAFIKRFGSAEWFNMVFRAPLTLLVRACRRRGYSDLPYTDKPW